MKNGDSVSIQNQIVIYIKSHLLNVLAKRNIQAIIAKQSNDGADGGICFRANFI